MSTLKREEKALVKDLELQIDFLIGYAPSGLHWKQEYHVRKTLIDEVFENENTPKEIREKIFRIQESLYKLHNQERNNQEYLQYSQNDYILRDDITIKDWKTKNKDKYKELPDELKDKRYPWWKYDPYFEPNILPIDKNKSI